MKLLRHRNYITSSVNSQAATTSILLENLLLTVFSRELLTTWGRDGHLLARQSVVEVGTCAVEGSVNRSCVGQGPGCCARVTSKNFVNRHLVLVLLAQRL